MALDSHQLEKGRRSLDERLGRLPKPGAWAPPVGGWLRAVREVLGITRKRAADTMGVKPSSLVDLEKSEVAETVTLASLRRAARAMGCDLVYAVVPLQGTLESTAARMRDQELAPAVGRVGLTMQLEEQGIDQASAAAIARRVASQRRRRP